MTSLARKQFERDLSEARQLSVGKPGYLTLLDHAETSWKVRDYRHAKNLIIKVLLAFDCVPGENAAVDRFVHETEASVAVTENPSPVTKISLKPKAKHEVISLPLSGIPKRRGRPRSANPLSNSERQRNFREKRAQELKAKLESASQSFAEETEEGLLEWLVKAGPKLQEKAWLELGRRKGWKLP